MLLACSSSHSLPVFACASLSFFCRVLGKAASRISAAGPATSAQLCRYSWSRRRQPSAVASTRRRKQRGDAVSTRQCHTNDDAPASISSASWARGEMVGRSHSTRVSYHRTRMGNAFLRSASFFLMASCFALIFLLKAACISFCDGFFFLLTHSRARGRSWTCGEGAKGKRFNGSTHVSVSGFSRAPTHGLNQKGSTHPPTHEQNSHEIKRTSKSSSVWTKASSRLSPLCWMMMLCCLWPYLWSAARLRSTKKPQESTAEIQTRQSTGTGRAGTQRSKEKQSIFALATDGSAGRERA